MNIRLSRWVRTILPLAIFAVLAVSGIRAHSQAVYGQIQGNVTDPTGAAVPGATITVKDVSKGSVVTVVSKDNGEFVVEHLIPDAYDVKVEAKNFKSYEQKGINIFADTTDNVHAILALGAATETVEVDATDIPQLKTDRADVATNYTAEELTELPIPDHNFANLQLLLPGAVQLGWAHAASENPQGSKQIQIDGQAFGGVNYTLDGTDNQDAILGIIVINPNSESMSEAKIATQNFDAEFGKAVASVDTVQTKSGTNSFHGTGFENYESNSFLAKDPFTFTPGAPTSYLPGTKHQFGGSIGGPVIKNKDFFFGDYQGVRQTIGSTGTGSVPSLLALNSCTGTTKASDGSSSCDFSDYLADGFQIYNNTGVAVGTTAAGAAFAGNRIPLVNLPSGNPVVSPQAQNLFNLLLKNKYTPNATGIDNGLENNYVGSGSGSFNSDQWDVRGDSNLSDKTHLFGRFSRFTDTLAGAQLFGPAGGPGLGVAGYGGVSQGSNDSYALGVDVALSPQWLTDVRLGYFRYNIITHKNDPGNTNLPFIGENTSGDGLTVVDWGTQDINIADLNVQNGGGPSNPQNGGAQFGTGLNMNHCNCPLKEKEDQMQLVNNWTRIAGTHTIKFGVDLRYARNLRVPSDSDRTGVNNFGDGPTSSGGSVGGLGWATFILGDVTAFNRYTSASPTEVNAKEFQRRDYFYAQDTWRATLKLTVNAGIRYEAYSPERVNGKGNGALLNLATGYINVAGEGGIGLNMGVKSPANTWNPRMGIAYQFTPKSVLRVGYGRSFDLGVFGSTFGHVVTQNIPVLANQSLNTSGAGTNYAFNLSGPAANYTANATSPLIPFTSPAISNGQIAINAVIPNSGGTTIAQSVNVKARPFTMRLPTLDAWNASFQQTLNGTTTVEIAYVGNKGSHTLSDGDGNNTNPNEPGNYLPASYSSIGGVALHYDNVPGDQPYTNSAGVTVPGAIAVYCTTSPSNCTNGVPTMGPYAGATNSRNLLRRFNGGSLPACNGPCGWTQDISYYGDDQDTHYNALQAKFTKTFSKGLSANANYAYQVGRDANSGYATWDKAAVIGNDSAIRRSAFTAYGLYKLPFGKDQMFLNEGGALNYIVGGWELSPTFVWQSGLPYTLGFNECGDFTVGPCYVNGQNSQLHKFKTGYPGSNLSWFQSPTGGQNLCTGTQIVSAFSCSGLGSVGDGGRNNAWGPGFFNSDISLMKNVAVLEKFTAEFRFDAYNAFNHINFGNPNGTIDQGSAGSIGGGSYPAGTGGTTNPRQLQFTVHLAF
jgi:hypothetical protein